MRLDSDGPLNLRRILYLKCDREPLKEFEPVDNVIRALFGEDTANRYVLERLK